jgi:hypothetical protein
MARWNSCNLLQTTPEGRRLWQFDAKGGGFVPGRELRLAHTDPIPAKLVAKNWSSLWQPKLNVAWLPPENVFLRVTELPASNAEETFAMVEFQLEKLSPIPVAQIVWTYHILPRTGPENLQTIIVVIVARSLVEEFLGRLERDGFLADRLEAPMLDQLEAITPAGDGAWIFPQPSTGAANALVAWWCGGALRNLSYVSLPAAGDRATELKNQLAHIVWSGELEGWLTGTPRWHLVADPVTAAEWQQWLRSGLNEPVTVQDPAPAVELAGRTAKRSAAEARARLLPPEYTGRYHQQFVDRLWLHGLGYAGLLYAVSLVIYFCAVAVLGYRTGNLESQVSALSGSYTNSLQLTAQYNVLSERQHLKYAALDCWQQVAEQLPPSITLQRFSLADGHRLTLSGTTTEDQIDTLFSFYTSMQKLKVNGQFVFDQVDAEPPSPKLIGNSEQWSFSLQLLHAEEEQP